MFSKIKLAIIQFIVKKYALGYLITAYKFIKGYKTQICLAGMILTWLLEVFQAITHEQAISVYTWLGGAGSVTFMAKLKGYEDIAKNVAGDIITGAKVDDKPIDPPAPTIV